MSLYSAPTKIGAPFTNRWCVSLASEKDSGVKHTHLGMGGAGYSLQKGPTDAIGSTTLTLTNVVIGSAIRIEVASTGALVEARTADTTTEVFTLPVYDASNPANDLRVKVRKGSASTFYKPYETLATLTTAPQSVYIAQIPD